MLRNACTCACASLVSRLLGHIEKRCVCDSDIADHFTSTLLPCPVKSRPTSGDFHGHLPPGVPISS